MEKKDIETILRDFKMVSGNAFDYFEERNKRKPFANGEKEEHISMPPFYILRCNVILYPNGIAWFGGGEGIDKVPGYGEKPIGNPKDYIGIRDDTEKLAGFIGKTLDRGILERHSPSGHGDWGETYTADYILWLYWCCGKAIFKRRVESAVAGFLEAELKKEFLPFEKFKEKYNPEEPIMRVEGDYAAQFNRLAGLLHVVAEAGTPCNGFAKAGSMLEQKVKEGFLREAPDLPHYDPHTAASHMNVYRWMIKALGAVWNKP